MRCTPGSPKFWRVRPVKGVGLGVVFADTGNDVKEPSYALRPITQRRQIVGPPDLGRNRPETLDSPKEMAVRTLPRDPRGSGTKSKTRNAS